MRLIIIISLLSLVICVKAAHFVVGNVANRVILDYHEKIEYNAIPFVKRVKQFFYSVPSQRKIQGIQALDLLLSKASINVTAGGVGYPFVNLRIKSERGTALEYDIGIYVSPDFQ